MGVVAEEKKAAAEPTPEQAQAEAEAQFDAGFTGEPTATPAEEKSESTPAEEKTEPVKVEPVIEYAQWTKEEKDNLVAAHKAVGELKALIDKGFGSFGGKLGALEQKIREAQAATPVGEAVALSDDDFADLKKEYPELAGFLKNDLTKIFGRLKGTGKVELDEGKIKALITDTTAPLVKENQELALDVMDTWRDNWHETVTGEKFRAWLGQQPEAFRQDIQATWKPSAMKAAILRFEKETAPKKAEEQTKPETPDPHRNRLKAAVQPKGDGQGTKKVSGALSDEEAFDAGFQSRS